MKNECNVIRDILPLYVENMASVDTALFVKAHLESCADCRAELDKMKNPNSLEKMCGDISVAAENDALSLKTLRKKYNRKILLIIAVTAAVTALVFAICAYLSLQITFPQSLWADSIKIEFDGGGFIRMLLNLGSVVLGLGAWLLPSVALFKKNMPNNGFMIGSFGMCISALCCQFFEIRYLMRTDFSAIDDTIDFLVQVAIILSAVTLVLNIVVLLKQKICNPHKNIR